MKTCVELTYEDRGTGNVPIVCLHGIGGNADSFRPQLDELCDQTRVIALNLPGYDGSKPISPVTFETLGDKLLAFLDELRIEQVVLCGQSIGGMLALDFSCRFANRVQDLILIATTSAFGGRDDRFKEEFLQARLAPLNTGKPMSELANEFVPQIVGPIATPAVIADAVRSMSAVSPMTYRTIIACLTTFNRREDVGKLALKTCVIAGEFDQNAPPKTMQRMAEKMPNATFHLIKGAGHLVNLEDGKTTNDILRNFLNLGGQNDH